MLQHGVNDGICPGLPLFIVGFIPSAAIEFTDGSEAASQASLVITITATTSGDISLGVFGVEVNINGVDAFSVNVVGAAANQSITIGVGDGIQQGDVLIITPYYNLVAGDPSNTRVYGDAVTIIASEFDGLLLGQA